jgi:hypothetical protein
MDQMKYLRNIGLTIIATIALSSCETENKYENFQRLRFVYHDYNAKIDADAEKFLPSGDRYSVLTYSDSALNFEFDIDFNAQSIHEKEAILPDWLTWTKSTVGSDEPVLVLDWDNVDNQNFAASIKPIVVEKQEYPILKRNDGTNYYISPRKRLCLDSYLPGAYGAYGTREVSELGILNNSLVRCKIGRNYVGYKGEGLAVPIAGGALKASGVGVLTFRKSQIDSIASLQGGNPIQPYYLLQDESQSYEISDNGKGYYSLVFYGNTDHQNKPAGWLQVGNEKFQLPRFNGNFSRAKGEIYEVVFTESSLYLKTHQLYR